jgi:DNA invertase Pin-like site-specific DNA recombinase
MKSTRVGLYARVSTLDRGQDTEVQLHELRSYAQARGWTIASEYVDKGQSGAKDRRPELDRMLGDARKRKIDLILCQRLDRLGRSLKHLILTLDELQALGVGFISYSENLDLTTSTGRLMFQLLGAFAEFERNLIRERVVSGLRNARAKGTRLGRPSPEVDTEELTHLRSNGLSIRKIAAQMNLDKMTVCKTLKFYGQET